MRLIVVGAALCLALATGLLAWINLSSKPDLRVLRFSAGSPGGEYHNFSVALATLLRQVGSSLEIAALPSTGALDNATAVANGSADLGLVQTDTPVAANVQAIANVFPEVLHIIVRRDAGIRTPADLGRKRIMLMPQGSGTNTLFLRIMAHYGYAAEDFVLTYADPDSAAAALERGEADAMVRVIALGNASIRNLLRNDGLALLPIDQAKAIEMFSPALQRLTIPRGALGGRPAAPTDDIEAVGVRAVFVANAAVPEPDVHKIVATMFQGRTQLVALDRQTALMESPRSLTALGFTVHPGAEAYFTENEPGFIQRNTDAIGLALSSAALFASGLWQLRRWANEKRKNRGDLYNSEIAEEIEALRRAVDRTELAAVEDRMFRKFHRVLNDIDQDRVARETIPTFDFVWRSALDLLTARKLELASGSGAFPVVDVVAETRS
jgi:TRAP transporter TAXI family solute receptor